MARWTERAALVVVSDHSRMSCSSRTPFRLHRQSRSSLKEISRGAAVKTTASASITEQDEKEDIHIDSSLLHRELIPSAVLWGCIPHYYAGLAISSLAVAKTIVSTYCTYLQRMARLSGLDQYGNSAQNQPPKHKLLFRNNGVMTSHRLHYGMGKGSLIGKFLDQPMYHIY